ncbi:MAG: M23 family metallopeptidase [Pseudomonadota bacterium]
MRWICALAAFALLSGCFVKEYGYSAPYVARQPFFVEVPMNAPSISQQFRRGAGNADHLGLDFVAPLGTQVLAAAPGRVTRSFFDPAYGNMVELSHGTDANGAPILTRYAHLKERLAMAGSSVARGDPIGTLGRSGVLAGGLLHLHFEIWVGSRRDPQNAKDPNLFWIGGPGQVACFNGATNPPVSPFRISHPVMCR